VKRVPAFITMLATPLTFSIATGLSLGLICYTVVKVCGWGRFVKSMRSSGYVRFSLFLRYIYLATA